MTITSALPTQFKLDDAGQIHFQPNSTNPLPGDVIARVKKGDAILAPLVELTTEQDNREAVTAFLNEWVKAHVRKVLEPLVALEQTENTAEPVKAICRQLYEAMGIVPREQIEDLITKLDPEMRQQLRAKQVRLGPILVFIPALNKPAGVRLRGLLWSLWNERTDAPALPHDGVMSFKAELKEEDKKFYLAIGYPVYGPRAIRIDMLDRVINAVYENAKDGKFQAKHQMAEWLGCGIEDLYAVLEAMGHRKINMTPEVPAIEQKTEEGSAPVVEEPKTDDAKPVQVKPELAMFYLKKGKAFEQRQPRPAKTEFKHKPKPKADRKKAPKKEDRSRTMQATLKAKPEDSPFAILEKLKAKKDAS